MRTSILRRTVVAAVLLTLPLSVEAQFTENFDDIATLNAAGWAFQNNSNPLGITEWFQGNEVVFESHNGAPNSYMAANFNSGGDLATISNWAMTPVFNLADGAQFSFFTRTAGSIFPDRLELRLSTSGASTNVGTSAFDVGDFSTLLLSVNPALGGDYPEDWTQFSTTLAGFGAPVMGRFAFRYFVEEGGPFGNNSNFIGIDEVAFREGVVAGVPEPTTLALLGLGLSGLVMVRRRRQA